MEIKEVVHEYIECGREHGFAIAECILAKHTPGVLYSKCYHVPARKRKAFVRDLKLGSAALKSGATVNVA